METPVQCVKPVQSQQEVSPLLSLNRSLTHCSDVSIVELEQENAS